MPFRHPVKNVYIGHGKQGDKGAVRLLRTSGSPRAYALAMTRVVKVRSVCYCEEDRIDDAAIHRV